MSEFQNENTNGTEDITEESTIFSEPSVKNDKVKHKHPKRLLAILLAMCIVVASGTFAAIKLIPKPEEEEEGSLSFEVMINDLSSVERIEFKNELESITFLCEVENAEADESHSENLVDTWSIEGISKRLIDNDKVADCVHYFANIYAIKKIDAEPEEYGMDKPFAEFTVYPRDDSFETYTVKVGNESHDNIGRYISISGIDGVYLVDSDYTEQFIKVSTDFATNNAIAQIELTDDIKDYFEKDLLATCDSIVLSGKNFDPAVTFEPNNTEETSTYSAYLITSPVTRYATGVDELLNLAANGLVGGGAYVFNPTDEQIAEYGLNDPLAHVEINIGSVKYDIKIADSPINDDKGSYYCVIDQNKEAIFKVSVDSLSFVKNSVTDYYNSFLVMEMLNSLSDFNVTMNGEKYNFQIKYNDSEDDSSDFDITLGGKNGITQEYFQNFYTYFLSLEVVEYTTYDVSSVSPVYSVVLKHSNNDISDVTMDIYKITDQRYQVNVGGDGMGLITSSAYKKLVKYTEAVSKNTDLQ